MRISTTLLDDFRFYKEDAPFMARETLIKRIKREDFVETEAMRRGTAFHKMLEDSQKIKHDWSKPFLINGFNFLNPQIAVDVVPHDGLHELKHVEIIEGHQVVSKVDLMRGKDIQEYKTTSQFEVDKYMQSVQWRYYLRAFQCNFVVYHVFEVYQKGIDVTIKKHHPIVCAKYPELEADTRQHLLDFITFVKAEKLESYLPEKQDGFIE